MSLCLSGQYVKFEDPYKIKDFYYLYFYPPWGNLLQPITATQTQSFYFDEFQYCFVLMSNLRKYEKNIY